MDRRATLLLALLVAACGAPRGMRAEPGPPMELSGPISGTAVVVGERPIAPGDGPGGVEPGPDFDLPR